MSEIKLKRWHKYGKWQPWRKKDNWEPLRKNGRKKWSTFITQAQVELEMWTIANWLTFWKTKIDNKKNKELWVKSNTPLTVIEACREYWIAPITFYTHLDRFPWMKKQFQEMKVHRREYIKELAENNIVSVLEKWDLTDKEKFDASFKVVQATMKEYNPKTEVESKSINININKSSEDIMADLSNILWI